MILCNFDKRGAEWLVVAYLTGDSNMIAAVNSPRSPHVTTGRLISGASEDLIEKEAKLLGEASDPNLLNEARKKLIPEIFSARFLPRTMTIRQCAKKCLAPGTEVLTRAGWVAIEFVKVGQEVVQWDQWKLSFVPVSAVHHYKNDAPLILLQNKHISQAVTPDHRIPVFDRNAALSTPLAQDFKGRSHESLPLSGYLVQKHSLLTEFETRLLVAAQADGSVTPYGDLIFRFKTPRKIQRLHWLFENLKINSEIKNGFVRLPRSDIVDRITWYLCNFKYIRQKRSKIKNPRRGNLLKNFGPYLLLLGGKELTAFVEELCHWDGYARDRSVGGTHGYFFTTNKNNAQWAQTVAHLTGRRALCIGKKPTGGFGKKILYKVKLGTANNTTASLVSVGSVLHQRSVHCITVPSGFFLIRYNGRISVSANSNHGINYGESFRTFALMNEIEESEAKRIINLYRHEAYPGIPDWYQRIQKQLHKDRTLTNCFGRKCYFMEAWGEDLFRQGYAFLPQSTVGDMVNEGIIKTINDPTLGHVQLLSQVHDSGVFQYPEPRVKYWWENLARDCIKIGLDYLSPECEYTAKFTIPTDLKIGKNWGSTNMVEVHLTRDEGKLADDLAAAWEQCNTQKEAA